MVLITNPQSNILQDIDSLHLFAQVVTSICKSLEEQEILQNAFELLSAFDEVVSLGYRENHSLQQIKTFLEMESHEERIQDIIARNKEFEASEERKRKAKQLELQRKEMARSNSGMGGGSGGMGGGMGSSSVRSSAPKFSNFTPPKLPDTYDTYEAERNKKPFASSALKGKGMQLGKKSKTTNMFERVRDEMGADAEERAPLVAQESAVAPGRPSLSSDAGPAISVLVAEQISAEVARDGTLKTFEVKGNLTLRITDPSLTKLRLSVTTDPNVQFRTHPNVDKAVFTKQNLLQLKDTSREFPLNQQGTLLRWAHTAVQDAPIAFTVWVNPAAGGAANKYNVTIEYELSNTADTLRDVIVSIPFRGDEPTVASMDEVYEVSGDSLDWTLSSVSEDNSSGSFEIEADAEDESDFFPMRVNFRMERPVVDVEVSHPTQSVCWYRANERRSRTSSLSTWARASSSPRRCGAWRRTMLLSDLWLLRWLP